MVSSWGITCLGLCSLTEWTSACYEVSHNSSPLVSHNFILPSIVICDVVEMLAFNLLVIYSDTINNIQCI